VLEGDAGRFLQQLDGQVVHRADPGAGEVHPPRMRFA
jgi:hypothetical protein